MTRPLLALALLPCVALADPNPKFEKLKSSAEPLTGLSNFLEKYVGECEGAPPDCKANAAAFRREANGKKFYMIVGEDSAMVAPGRATDDAITLNVTPFFPAGGYALTHGAPHRADANGNPVMPLIYVKAKIPEMMNAGSVARLVGTRGIRIELVFTPQEVWSLPKKEEGKKNAKSYGVKTRIEAMLISVARTGEEMAYWTGR